MTKFVYVGDPKGGVNAAGAVTYTGPNNEKVTFRAGEPTECPDWFAGRLARNSHFTQVVEGGAEVVVGDKPKNKGGRPRKVEAETVETDPAE